jgi:hypothetical protein
MNIPTPYASLEELRYAKVLQIATRLGLVLLVLSFLVYMSGLVPALVPVDQLSQYWGLSAREFVTATHTPTGWAWVGLVGYGDVLNVAAIAFLGGVSGLCLLAVLPLLVRRGDWVHVLVALAQIAVLVLSASNLLSIAR